MLVVLLGCCSLTTDQPALIAHRSRLYRSVLMSHPSLDHGEGGSVVEQDRFVTLMCDSIHGRHLFEMDNHVYTLSHLIIFPAIR